MTRIMVELEMDETSEAALRAANEGMQLPYLFEGVVIGYEGQEIHADMRLPS